MPKGANLKFEPEDKIDFGNIEVPVLGDLDWLSENDTDTPPPIITRYTTPQVRPTTENYILYDNAEDLARNMRPTIGSRQHAIVSGNFVFGDFIEALLVVHNIQATEMTIATLSLNQNNVDSLYHLMRTDHIVRLNLIVSSYFFGNERHGLIPYIYQSLDHDDRFQLAVAGVHTKTVHFATLGGRHIVIHGSANLRSSGNVEQFCIEENADLYRFYEQVYSPIIERYKRVGASNVVCCLVVAVLLRMGCVWAAYGFWFECFLLRFMVC